MPLVKSSPPLHTGASTHYACTVHGAQVTDVPLPVNITDGAGTTTYVTLSAVNTTGKPGNLTVLQVCTQCDCSKPPAVWHAWV